VRIARGGTVMAPGTPNDPVQIIDARDLAEWTIRMAEQRATGIYNATGPRAPLTIAEMLYGIRASQSGDNVVRFEWVPQDFLDEHQVRGWSHMPVWVPVRDDNAGFARVSIERAVAKGLTFRPLAVPARDTLDWFQTLPAERQAEMRAGLPAEREVEVLRAWEARRTGGAGASRRPPGGCAPPHPTRDAYGSTICARSIRSRSPNSRRRYCSPSVTSRRSFGPRPSGASSPYAPFSRSTIIIPSTTRPNGTKPAPSSASLSRYLMHACVDRVFGPAIANAIVPRRLLCTSGSSSSEWPRHACAISGSPCRPNCATKPGT